MNKNCIKKPVEQTGALLISTAKIAGGTILLLSRSLYWAKSFFPDRRKIIIQMDRSGVESLPIILLVSAFTGMVLALQTGLELGKFHAEEMIGSLVVVSMVREMGPVMTAIIVAGRAGAAIAAELSTMRVSEEIDALEAMSINPARFLVMPRTISLLLMMPVLTLFSILIGILGGALIGQTLMSVHYISFFQRGVDFLRYKDIASGMTKAVLFSVVISSISCYQGLNASGGAEGVGRATTKAVVLSFLFVIITNYIITGFFYD
jgi:phospholipid/cholesterol/gamma-HCH transport system permease protein